MCVALALQGTSAFAELARPQRIVSLNLCTDQILLQLVEPSRIASLTFLSFEPGATNEKYLPLLRHVKPNHGLAEEVLALNSDLVVSGIYAARTTTALLRKVGQNVVVFEPENSFEDMRASIRRMGVAVGEERRAAHLIAAFDAELAALKAQVPPGPAPIYADIGVNYWMAGQGTLYGEIVNAGGFRTLGDVMGFSGHRSVPLETLVRLKPALISTDTQYDHPPSLSTQALRHPLLRQMAAETPRLSIPPRYTVCATPESLSAIRMLIAAREAIDARGASH
jgi:iron complex transport system substrate-binding protein